MDRKTGPTAGGAFALTLALTGAAVHADDTEIYVGGTAEGKKPNVLFIMDTSGSMDTLEEVQQTPYDDSVDYPGSCEEGRIYWTEESRWGSEEPPTCGTERYVHRDAIVCDDITDALDSSSGMAIAQAAQERGGGGWFGRWQSLQEGNHDDDVDCRGGWGSETYQFYTANYVNWYHSVGGGSEQMTRMEIVQDVAKDLVDSVSGINIGLMRFDQGPGGQGYGDEWDGGFVDIPVDDIADNRELFKQAIDSYHPLGSTPLSETMYEATQYWRGGRIHYGNRTNPRQSAPRSRDGEDYISPIEDACQKNHIVYLTDGEPQYDNDADWRIERLLGRGCRGNCLDELAEYLYEEDLRTGVAGKNNVITHTIGFHTDQDLLRDTASKGGGNYYTADSYDQLKTSLTELFTEILSGTSLFTAPAVSVNAFNRLNHLEQVYFALFRPTEGNVWQGNVKRYRLDPDSGELVDANTDPAVNESTGEFRDDITSFWSDVQDGNDVRLGGMAGELETDRDVYTYVGDGQDVLLTGHPLHEDNNDLTPGLLGLAGDQDDYRDKLLRWARGIDVDDADGDGARDDARREMGDPLHSRPVLVTYGDDPDDPNLTLFVTTNEGYLHAVDAATGEELFAFMPGELLPNIRTQYENTFSEDRLYGLDGPVAVGTGGDRLRLFVGQRRGGKRYYALDVTNRNRPRLLWTISGGEGGEFGELGQTWSQPVPTRIDLGGEVRDVVVFAGGYDPDQDTHAVRTPDDQGRAVFIVDAASGDLLWSGGATGDHDETFADMEYSIPSDLRVIDINGDGLADQMYVGDMGGQLWRFDVHNGSGAGDLVTGGVIAEFSEDDDPADNRRFYYAPDIALINEGGRQWLSVSIGSGWRAHPLDDVVRDRFYMIRNSDLFDAPRDGDGEPDYESIGEQDLYDATDNLIVEGTTEEQRRLERNELRDSEGWYIELERSGEKVLAESVTLNGQVVFTTYQPSEGETGSSCAPGQGIGRTYVVNATDATPVRDQDEDGEREADERATELERGGIPPQPTPVFIDGETTVLVGPEQIDYLDDSDRQVVYWRERR